MLGNCPCSAGFFELARVFLVQQAVLHPQPPSVPSKVISPSKPEPLSCAFPSSLRSFASRIGELPLTDPVISVAPRRTVIVSELRELISSIEQRARAPDARLAGSDWTLGADEIDARLEGLDASGVHEIKPIVPEPGRSVAGDCAAAFSFAWGLATRRINSQRGESEAPSPSLWCWTKGWGQELGTPYGPGLSLGAPDCERLLCVETRTRSDALWVVEEALKSRALSLVGCLIDEVELTPARRLSLAAIAGRTPCLLLTHPRSEPVAAVQSRWRIGTHPSAPHFFDPEAPGLPRWRVVLERWRSGCLGSETLETTLEWSDATLSFHMVPGLGNRATGTAKSRAGPHRQSNGARR